VCVCTDRYSVEGAGPEFFSILFFAAERQSCFDGKHKCRTGEPIANFRNQWIGPASPYITGTISYDAKMFQKKIPNVENDGNVFGLGGMLMYDKAMGGVVKSSYASMDLSYKVKVKQRRNKTLFNRRLWNYLWTSKN
jgi:hypothetical protein